MKRITVVVLCLILCLGGTAVPTASGAVLTTSAKTALVSCLQQVTLMRDVYQDVFAKYPTLTTFGDVAVQETVMIAALKKAFAKYRMTLPADTWSLAARTVSSKVTSVPTAHAVAINLEQSTAAMMGKLLQTTRSTDVAALEALIKTTSLGSHIHAFIAEQTSVSDPVPASPAQRVASFRPNQAASVFLTLLGDESIDVIELDGVYHLPDIHIDVDRTRPVVVRPAAGATVVLSGANIGGTAQFEIGDHGTAGNIAMQGLIFDGYTLGQMGIIHVFNAHDITLNDMTVRNSRANGTTAQPYHSWALYITSTSTVIPTNITASRWTVDISARRMSALKVYGGSHITATSWSVTGAYLGIYGYSDRGSLTDFILDDWTISDTGTLVWWTANVSVAIENASGRFSNMHLVASGVLLNLGTPKMTDGGGNSLSVPQRSSPLLLTPRSNLTT